MEAWRKYQAKRRWLAAGCALAVMCACAWPRLGLGQASGTSSTASDSVSKTEKNVTTARKKKATSKRHVTAGAKSSRASSAYTARPRTASHSGSTTGAQPKPSTAAVRSSKSKYASTRKGGKKKTTARGQQKIDPERAQAIQEALIREHYLSGEAAGKWDQASEDAMRRYQADHGWQAKTVPDARALISLGLGPNHDHLLNPDSAMTTEPAPSHAESSSPSPHGAPPGAPITTTTPIVPASAPPPAHDSSSPQ